MYLSVVGATDLAYARLMPAAAGNWVETESLWNSWTASLREDRRFASLVRELDMVEYWRTYGPPDGCKLQGDVLICN
jgi:hypothetical protein